MLSKIHIANRRSARRFVSLPFLLLTWVLMAAPLVAAVAAITTLRRYERGLPPIPPVDELLLSLPQSSTFVAADGTIALELPFTAGTIVGHRTVVRMSEVPPRLVLAFLAAEDVRFFSHHGVDYRAVARAAWANYRAGSVVEGASTITQQLARNLLPVAIGNERSVDRKIREALLARRIEQAFSKSQIFEAYANYVFLGSSAYGVFAAARIYFGKSLVELDLAEAALIAGLAQAPGRADPNKDLDAALSRRNEVLDRMLRAGFIDAGAHEIARAKEVHLNPPNERYGTVTPWDTEAARRALDESSIRSRALGGLRVEMTAQPALFAAAHQLVRSATAKLAATDGLVPEASATLIDYRTGYIEAVVGGRETGASLFDRARMACRQPGSAWKPIVYGAAIAAREITAGTPLRDAPIAEYDEVTDVHWKPSNSGHRFRGVALAIDALASSLNAPAVHVLDRVGAARVVALARRLGISSEVADVRPMALGASCVKPFELTRAFAIIARRGELFTPIGIKRVLRGQTVLLDQSDWRDANLSPRTRLDRLAARGGRPPRDHALDAGSAFILTDMLRAVVVRGTGTAARSLPFEVAGKTGTTNDNTDAWFVGFSGRIAAGVWVGHDDPSHTLGRNHDGGHAALPLWANILRLTDSKGTSFAVPGAPPNGLVERRIDRETGLLAAPRAGGASDLWFLAGTEPVEEAGGSGGRGFDLGRSVRDF